MPLAATLLFLEAGARVAEYFSPPLAVDAGMGFDESSRLFVPAPGELNARITNPAKLEGFTPQKFRLPKPQGTLRIAVLGESSVRFLEENLVRLGRTLTARAHGGDGKRVEFINAGGSSYGSQRLVIVARELVEYEPDLVILYIGNNEFEELDQLQLYVPGTAATQEALGHFAFFRLLRDSIARTWIDRLRREHDQRMLAVAPTEFDADKHVFSSSEAADRMTAFRANLGEIIERFRLHNIPTLIGTVPSNLVNPYLFRRYQSDYEPFRSLMAEGRYEDAKKFAHAYLSRQYDRHQSSDAENAVIREVAASHRVPLVDIEKIVTEAEPHGIPGETLFVDHCHLTDKGRELWAGAFERAITALPLFETFSRKTAGARPRPR